MIWARYLVPSFLLNLVLIMELYGMGLVIRNRLGAGPVDLSWLTAISIVCYGLACPFTARLATRLGRLRTLAGTGLLVTGISLLVPHLGDSILRHHGMAGLLGLTAALFWPTVQAHLSDAVPADRLVRTLGLFNLAWASGEALGLLLPGGLFETRPFLVFHLGAASGLGLTASIAISGLLPAEDGPPESSLPADRPSGRLEPPSPERASRFFGLGLLFNFCVWGAFRTVLALFPDLGETAFGLAPAAQGRVLFGAAGGHLVAFALLMQTTGWAYRPRWIVASLALLAAACGGLLGLAGGSGALVAAGATVLVLALAAGVSFSYASSQLYAVDAAELRWRRTGLHEMALGAGAFLVPLYGGYAAEWFAHPGAPFGALAALLAAGAAGLWWWSPPAEAD